VRCDVHDGHSWNFSYSPLEVLVAGGHDVASVLLDAVDEAVVGVGALVVALEALEAWVFGNAEGYSVLNSEFLEFSDHAVGDVGDALAEEAVHGSLEDVQFVLDAEVDEVGIQ
jgi:hypothetical protein